MTATRTTVRYRVSGMDCSDCADEIETATRAVSGVEEVRVSIASRVMTVYLADANSGALEIERVVSGLGYQLDRVNADGSGGDGVATPSAHMTASYRRALWAVVLLNVGYGLIEIVGGFLSDSQALKADALDFLGDGTITFMGIVAIGWGLVWRARSALVQGVFLGALGIGVLANTIVRLRAGYEPQADLMGLFGVIALVVNVVAALVLIPHRAGDANVRAVWLFSRNDAIGNLAVVIAAGLVAWMGTPWPDLAVAFVIAGLFLQSSLSIILDAQRDAQDARTKQVC